MRRSVAVLALAAALGACSQDAPPILTPATVSGAIFGTTFRVTDAFSGKRTVSANLASGEIAFLDGATGVCDLIAQGETPSSTRVLLTDVWVRTAPNDGAPPTMPGTFTVGSAGIGNDAELRYEEIDGSCAVARSALGVSGTITISTVNANGYAGSGDVTLDSGDHVSFTFVAPDCAAYTAVGTRTLACH